MLSLFVCAIILFLVFQNRKPSEDYFVNTKTLVNLCLTLLLMNLPKEQLDQGVVASLFAVYLLLFWALRRNVRC
jgi:hypothetical protein